MHEYYEEYLYTGYFFVCEVTGKGQMRLTDVEKERGVQPEWLPLQNAIELFSMHESYADVSEEKRGSYQREYIALKEYMTKKLEDDQSKEFILPFMASFEPTLVDAINLEHAGSFRSKTSKSLATILGYRKKTKDMSVTNLTKLDIPEEYGEYKLDFFSFIPPVISQTKQRLSA